MTNLTTTVTNPIVHVEAGRVFATSRDVAAFFEKRHDNVLRDINALLSTDPACALNFEETSGDVPMPRGGSRVERAYNMDRDGFTLLAMGFTGTKALQFKLRYISRVAAWRLILGGSKQRGLWQPQ